MDFLVQIDLSILGSKLDPAGITNSLGITPDTALRQGERNPQLGLPKSSIWSTRSTAKSKESFLEEHWSSLESKFAGKEELLRSISATGRIVVTIIVDGGDRIPSLYFPNRMIEFVARIGADLDIDINQ